MPRVLSNSQSHYTLSHLNHGNSTSKSVLPTRATSSTNLSMAPPDHRKTTLKSGRVGRSQAPILPLDSSDLSSTNRERSNGSNVSSAGSLKRSHFRAAESGKSDILPTVSSISANPSPSRRITSSSGSGSSWLPTLTSSSNKASSNNPVMDVRSRRNKGHSGGILPMYNHDVSLSPSPGSGSTKLGGILGQQRSQDHGNGISGRSTYRNTGVGDLGFGGKDRPLNFLRLFVVLLCCWLIVESYFKAVTTSEKMDKFNMEESMLMMHLQRLEQQALQLHDHIGLLVDRTNNNKNNNVPQQQQHQQQQAGDGTSQNNGDNDDTTKKNSPRNQHHMDSELIRVQKQQLQQMEEEVSIELRTLQSKLQQSARESIIENYGEGPLQLDIEFDLRGEMDNANKRLSIILWYETPYAAWHLIKQVREGLWTGAKFRFGKGYSLMATPNSTPKDIEDQTKLEFLEKSSKTHEAMTLGLANGDHGGLSMFINLQDNTAYHKYDACIGKVIDGFDALQQAVNAARKGKRSHDMVSIKSITASHLSKSQTAGLLD